MGLSSCSSVGIACVCKIMLFEITCCGGTTLEQFSWWLMFGRVGNSRISIQCSIFSTRSSFVI
jgi:hypothetical protein